MPVAPPSSQPPPWRTAYELLPKVSRTFALGIAGLKNPLRGSVCVAYLLCRILDTVEDAPGLSAAERWALMEPLLSCLESGGTPPPAWSARLIARLETLSAPADLALLKHSGDVLLCYAACEEMDRLSMTRWVTEMGKGMVAWSERMGEEPGAVKTLPSPAALDRYCYYIAGTVGYLLTDLFYIHAPGVDKALFFRLEQDAESFGLGLQKVNILKDLADDYHRGWCFLPTSLLKSEGLTPSDLAKTSRGPAIYRAALPVLLSTRGHLERAWRYLTLIPLEEREIRLFLAQSLFFAVRTLAMVARDPLRLAAPEKLKISRMEVAGLVASLALRISRPDALQDYFAECAASLAGLGSEEVRK